MPQNQDSGQIGIVNFYRLKNGTSRKGYLPLLLKVRLKEGAEFVYMNYQIARASYPNLLLEMFERLAVIKEEKEMNQFPETSEEVFERQEVIQMEPIPKVQRKKSSPHLRQIAALRQFNLNPPPLRKLRKDQQLRQSQQEQKQIRINNNEQDSPIFAPDCQELNKSQPTQQNVKVFKKILDYDALVFGMKIIDTPAIFPKAAPKSERPKATCQLSSNTNFKPFQREPFSDEEFRESQSEFLLDQNGRQRRRKERLEREQAMQSKQRLIKKKRKKVTRLI